MAQYPGRALRAGNAHARLELHQGSDSRAKYLDVPEGLVNDELVIAIANPFDQELQENLGFLLGTHYRLVIASPQAIELGIAAGYEALTPEIQTRQAEQAANRNSEGAIPRLARELMNTGVRPHRLGQDHCSAFHSEQAQPGGHLHRDYSAYKGRTVIAELLEVNPAQRELLLKGDADVASFKDAMRGTFNSLSFGTSSSVRPRRPQVTL